MRVVINSVLFLLLFSCSSLQSPSKNGCVENEKFKSKFFLSINSIELYVTGKGDRKAFKESLKFISKYVYVSYDKMLNYNNSYAQYEDFEKDKKEWIKWYETNKCNNIKLKY